MAGKKGSQAIVATNVFFDKATRETLSKAVQPAHSCVFISHRQADAEAAFDIAQFLKNSVGVNIYIDVSDHNLQRAVSEQNIVDVVNYIEQGIRVSTHLLSVLSSETRGSWWVPFEFGAARQLGHKTAHLLLEDVTSLPEYVSISNRLVDQYDLMGWARKLSIGYLAKAQAFSSYPNIRDLPELRNI